MGSPWISKKSNETEDQIATSHTHNRTSHSVVINDSDKKITVKNELIESPSGIHIALLITKRGELYETY